MRLIICFPSSLPGAVFLSTLGNARPSCSVSPKLLHSIGQLVRGFSEGFNKFENNGVKPSFLLPLLAFLIVWSSRWVSQDPRDAICGALLFRKTSEDAGLNQVGQKGTQV